MGVGQLPILILEVAREFLDLNGTKTLTGFVKVKPGKSSIASPVFISAKVQPILDHKRLLLFKKLYVWF